MKYRLLNMEELKTLEPEFVKFLAANAIPANEWQGLKDGQSPKVQELIAAFSDMVLERVLQKVQYVEQRSPHVFRAYHCRKDGMGVAALRISPKLGANLLDGKDLQRLAQGQVSRSDYGISIAKRPYQKQREIEVFGLLQNGGEISGGKLYEMLVGLQARFGG